MYKVQIKPGCRHGRLHADYNAKTVTGNPGPYAKAGEIIDVTQAELDAFGDKFIKLDPVTSVLSEPRAKSKPPTEQETIKRLAAELEQAQSAQLEAELEASNLRTAAKTAPVVRAKKPVARRGRPKQAASEKEA